MAYVLIWGASGGIGRALTESFVTQGHTVVAGARHPQGLETIPPYVVTGDIASGDGLAAAMQRVRVPSVDVFVYTIGDIVSMKITEMPPEAWQRIIHANLTGVYLTVQAVIPHLTPQAHLFFLGAQHERLRLPGLGAYAAAKAGLEALAEVIRKETRRRLAVVRPQAVRTPLWDKVPFRIPAHALSPEQVAQAILQAWKEGREGILDL